jgi:hypothetical protein
LSSWAEIRFADFGASLALVSGRIFAGNYPWLGSIPLKNMIVTGIDDPKYCLNIKIHDTAHKNW